MDCVRVLALGKSSRATLTTSIVVLALKSLKFVRETSNHSVIVTKLVLKRDFENYHAAEVRSACVV